MFSTALDYAAFMAAWLNGGDWNGTRLLPSRIVDEALQPHGAVDGVLVYGYLWFADDILPRHGRSFSHGGGDGTLAMGFPADDVIVVYMAHSRGGHHTERFGYGPAGVAPDLRYDLVPVGDHRFALGYYGPGGRVVLTLNPVFRAHLRLENRAVRSLEVTRGDETWFTGVQVRPH